MKKSLFYLVILLSFTLVMSSAAVQAQCEIDLSGVVRTLVQAQAAASAGDGDSAAELLADAQSELESLQSACAGGGTEVTTSELGETISVDFNGATLTFSYPTDWETKTERDSSMSIGSTESALLKNLFQAEVPNFEAGETLVNINLVNARFYGGAADADSSALDLLNTVLENTTSSLGDFSEVETLTIGDYEGAIVHIIGETYEIIFLMLDTGVEVNGEKAFNPMIGVTAPGGMDALEALMLQIAETIEVSA